MNHRASVLAACLSLAVILTPTQGMAADSSKKSDTNWKDIAKDRGFSAEDITRIERDKVLITGETFRQVFDPYLKSQLKARVPACSVERSVDHASIE